MPSSAESPGRARLRALRIIVAGVVLATALPMAGCEHAALYVGWAAPPRLVDCDLRPFPEPTLHGQLVHYWSLIGRWIVVSLCGAASGGSAGGQTGCVCRGVWPSSRSR